MSSPLAENLYSAKVESIRKALSKMGPPGFSALKIIAIGLIWLFAWFVSTKIEQTHHTMFLFVAAAAASYFVYQKEGW